MSQPAAPAKKGLSGGAIGGIVIAAVVLIFIFTNWQSGEIPLPLPDDAAAIWRWPSRPPAGSSQGS